MHIRTLYTTDGGSLSISMIDDSLFACRLLLLLKDGSLSEEEEEEGINIQATIMAPAMATQKGTKTRTPLAPIITPVINGPKADPQLPNYSNAID